ncbi:SufD family Fe-S cluster assembly protein [Novosphingobium umbonatum]|uniref:SufD family Fe-S cluster assembly protein n=1 Tax=Novosphingobium umbonatum TaxID=1908524 RepID=A0A3S2USF5_9SPHN|nr:SufD family Fe-S cluster assembly protein [Novosphingobium umbonatum]RVU05083.1 SufD family Fe-S cluster assembly protein [Novosphingobium umbonatum]
MSNLPTRKAEDWRYADLAALEKLWPLPDAESITVAAGDSFACAIINKGGVTRLSLTLEAGARAAVHVLNSADAYARIEIEATLHEGADFTLGGVQLAGGAQTAEIVATVRHMEPNANSRQILRSVAAGTATASVLGKVYVAKGADGTDGQQSMRAMLLDRSATANARPELEIHADDVKCAHGCAIGELDANGLFYMAARGIEPARAKALMLQAFVAEAFDGAEDEDHLHAAAQAALEALL